MLSASALFIVAAAAAGYIFSSQCYLFKYRVARQSGHRLYLHSFAVGLVFFTFAWLTDITVISLTRTLDIPVFFKMSPMDEATIVSISTIVFAWLAGEGYNRYVPEAKVNNYEKAIKNDDFELICYRALMSYKPIAVSMESRKVYVGLMIDTLEPGADSHLTILPVYSGYRDSRTLEFKLTSSYDPVIELLNDDEDLGDYLMAFPRDKIISLHIFNDHVYKSVNNQYANSSDSDQATTASLGDLPPIEVDQASQSHPPEL
ncbi:MAG: hypothetical protein ACI8QT_000002 [Halioglobus sp.]|jgi:hypothetical protein